MRIADTNVLLSLIVTDRPKHSVFAETSTASHDRGVLVTEAVLAEAVWVLCRSYHRTRAQAARLLIEALDGPGVSPWDRTQAVNALRLMEAEPSLGIVDCLLIERGLVLGAEVVSFDQRLCRRAQEYVEL
jgi:predicted nucleic acid-binding protein